MVDPASTGEHTKSPPPHCASDVQRHNESTHDDPGQSASEAHRNPGKIGSTRTLLTASATKALLKQVLAVPQFSFEGTTSFERNDPSTSAMIGFSFHVQLEW